MVSLWFPHFWGHLVIPAERRISGCHIFVVPNSHCVEKAMGFKESLDRRWLFMLFYLYTSIYVNHMKHAPTLVNGSLYNSMCETYDPRFNLLGGDQ